MMKKLVKKISVDIVSLSICMGSLPNYDVQASILSQESYMLAKCGIQPSDVTAIRTKATSSEDNQYIINYDHSEEILTVEETGNEYIKYSATDGKITNEIVYNKGRLFIDGTEIRVSSVENSFMDSDISTQATIWKGKKSLKPYGNLKSSSYNKRLASGKQNVALGRAMDKITVAALSACISQFHGYIGIAVSLAGIASEVKNAIKAIKPKTTYLGCSYTTYTCGAYDYKYINKFFANANCTGKSTTKLSYEHFIVY